MYVCMYVCMYVSRYDICVVMYQRSIVLLGNSDDYVLRVKKSKIILGSIF